MLEYRKTKYQAMAIEALALSTYFKCSAKS